MPPFAAGVVLFSTILHAGWNLIAKRRSDSWTTILRILAVICAPGLLIAVSTELFAVRLLPHVWPLLLGAGGAQAVYFLGLTLGYRAGDMGVVYPVTRALPVLFLGGFDLARNLSPSPAGWLGLALVAAGCIVISWDAGAGGRAAADGAAADDGRTATERRTAGGGAAVADRDSAAPVRLARRLHPTIGWAAVAAAGTVGYTAFDKLAAEVMRRELGGGLADALRYGMWEFVISTVLYAGLLAAAQRIAARRRPAPPPAAGASQSSRRSRWRAALDWRTAAAGFSMAGAYTLVLWAYQLSERASYVVALRQFSIVLGVAAGAALMRERAPVLRIGAAVVIVAGIALVGAAP